MERQSRYCNLQLEYRLNPRRHNLFFYNHYGYAEIVITKTS